MLLLVRRALGIIHEVACVLQHGHAMLSKELLKNTFGCNRGPYYKEMIMYLSRLTVDLRSDSLGKKWIKNRYRVHQRLCMAFPSDDRVKSDPDFLAPFASGDFAHGHVHVERELESGFLYRIDPASGGHAHILVQSAIRPNWEYAFHNAPYLVVEPVEVREMTVFVEKGKTYRFCLEANPTRKICTKTGPDGKKRNGRRVPVQVENMKSWLEDRCQKNNFGFVINSDETYVEPGYALMRKNPNGDVSKLRTARFEGQLTVSDLEAFVRCATKGIGPAKSLGFGLLSVVPH